MIAITGASGELGRLVIKCLLERISADQITGLIRDPSKAQGLVSLGVALRHADYNEPGTFAEALKGVDTLLLISSNETGVRTTQHRTVIDAAKASGIKLIAYTSVLHADVSSLGLAADHRDTEEALRESGIPYVLLRNGWYSENYLANVPSALEHGVLLGSAADGRISSAPRADYAEAAAVVLTTEGQAGKVYELAGDSSYTLSDLASMISQNTEKPVIYQDLPQSEFEAVLSSIGLPAGLAALLADSDAAAAQGALYDDSGMLSALIGRSTTAVLDSLMEIVQ
ncbi:SDR family oxidoreductase [Pseudomonas sp. FSL L8-0168]|uniref:SDR family oxidoreductase n=1 Tax=unclassified Pseudomonas TaxID=196821 RepID=UPI001CEFDE44|nr:SDR family oxidoreductase [Pseudomonas sp. PS1(2021)]UCM26612.1 SDR family oxidoreductase [Pseudomonas sp. PS1(2021)]